MSTRIATVPGHVCNMLCGDGLHVDRCWSEPVASEGDIAANWAYRYDVEIVEVRQVEPVPPPRTMPSGEAIVMVSGHRAMDQWAGCLTWGVWWREREIEVRDRATSRPRRPAPSCITRYPGICARTGHPYGIGTPIVRTRRGWAVKEDER